MLQIMALRKIRNLICWKKSEVNIMACIAFWRETGKNQCLLDKNEHLHWSLEQWSKLLCATDMNSSNHRESKHQFRQLWGKRVYLYT